MRVSRRRSTEPATPCGPTTIAAMGGTPCRPLALVTSLELANETIRDEVAADVIARLDETVGQTKAIADRS